MNYLNKQIKIKELVVKGKNINHQPYFLKINRSNLHSQMKGFIILLRIITLSYFSNTQTPFYSESIIKYDINTHKNDKPIPFDRSFTLIVEKINLKDIQKVELFEASFNNGNRDLVQNFLNKSNICGCIEYKSTKSNHNKLWTQDQSSIKAVVDKKLLFKQTGDTLQIYIPALKPNVEFDINIVSKLPPDSFTKLLKTVAFWSEDAEAEAKNEFTNLQKAEIDPLTRRNYFTAEYNELKIIYHDSLDSFYNKYSKSDEFVIVDSITLGELQAIVIALSNQKFNYRDAHFLVAATKNNQIKSLQLGLFDINNVYKKDNSTKMKYLHLREINLSKSLPYFDSLFIKVNNLIASGSNEITVDSNRISLEIVRQKLSLIRNAMADNLKSLNSTVNIISNILHKQKGVLHGFYLASNTVASDLKTAGGSVLFLDAGLTTMIIPGVTNSINYIPKMYWGVSIYFRPIDKNTRRNRFPKKFEEQKDCGKRNEENNGPDYGTLSKWSIWQHLSLNLGFTLGSFDNKEYENLYNNTSLLVGPAYRFARSFKISAGVALLKASNKNPLISDKKIVSGGYISLSTDIDFIQGLKDVTSILLK